MGRAKNLQLKSGLLKNHLVVHPHPACGHLLHEGEGKGSARAPACGFRRLAGIVPGGTSSTSSQINFEMGQGGTCPSHKQGCTLPRGEGGKLS